MVVAVARPIVASGVEAGRERSAIGVRARQNIVLVAGIAHSRSRRSALIQCGGLLDVVAVALLVAMQIGDIRSNRHALRIVPRSRPDAVACIRTGGLRCGLRAQIGVPNMIACAMRLSERLANPVCPGKATKIAATGHGAGDKNVIVCCAAWPCARTATEPSSITRIVETTIPLPMIGSPSRNQNHRVGRVASATSVEGAAMSCLLILLALSMIFRKARVASSNPQAGTRSAVSNVVW